ncbi:MAG: CRTAC1 family protein [Phycisphaerales bacterium]|nr:CRTAC1 family protein [Phycisphaerales bacterium]MCB9855951.1 CRTAC1 family protein [Phycisphaerales bacterium]MCB9864068.1 CRTAC1 family protein [Phycisphaerales bacterium]
MTDKQSEKKTGEPASIDPALEQNDAIIGVAFRWSVTAILLIAVVGGAMYFASQRKTENGPTTKATISPPEVSASTIEAPEIPFTNITTQAGIEFVHENGARGEKLLPETMGGGCAFFDYDNDGDQDLLFVNSSFWPDDDRRKTRQNAGVLYRNDGGGRFEDVSKAFGFDFDIYGMGVAAGDYDNDGDIDIFVTAVGENRLLRNDDGFFTDVTATAGVAGDEKDWSTGAAFFDADNDGDLDLFVCNYIRWSRQIDFAVDYKLTGVGRAYGPPTNFEGAQNSFYRNNGDGTFSDASESAGLFVMNQATGSPEGKGLALGIVDFDHDGNLDVFVANDTVRNFAFHNKGDGSFEEIGVEIGVAYDRMGAATGAMGVDVADLRDDGHLAVGIGNFANEMTSLYVAGDDPLQFTDASIVEGIGASSRLALTFGLFFFDADLDGRLDLLQCNGHLEDEINKVQSSQTYRQSAQLFWNAGPKERACFVETPAASVKDLATPIVGRGSAFADIDGDGDLDVVLTQTGGAPMLLRNDIPSGHHWLRLKLTGSKCNRDAIGAEIELTSGSLTQRRRVMPTRSYLSQSELPVTFGLGETDKVDRVVIRWPGGAEQIVPVDAVDRIIVVVQD